MWQLRSGCQSGRAIWGEISSRYQDSRALFRNTVDSPRDRLVTAASMATAARHAGQDHVPLPLDLHARNRMPWMRLEEHERMLEGLRKAGWRGHPIR